MCRRRASIRIRTCFANSEYSIEGARWGQKRRNFFTTLPTYTVTLWARNALTQQAELVLNCILNIYLRLRSTPKTF